MSRTKNIARPDLRLPVEVWGKIKGATAKLTWLQRVDACIAAGIVPRSFAHLAIKIATKWINEQTGLAWRGADKLADDIDMSQPSIARLLETAEAAGLLGVARRGRPGRGNTTIYRLAMPERQNPKPADVLPDVEILKPADVLPSTKSGRQTSTHGAGKHPSVPKKTSTHGYEPLKRNVRGMNPTERGSAARSADDDRESITSSTSDDATTPSRPDQRADALIDTVTAQQQPPCRASSAIGTPANGANAALRPFALVRAAFEDLRRGYPAERIGNPAKAYRAFCIAVDEHHMGTVVSEIADLTREHGPDAPMLAEALASISARLSRTRHQPLQQDEP